MYLHELHVSKRITTVEREIFPHATCDVSQPGFHLAKIHKSPLQIILGLHKSFPTLLKIWAKKTLHYIMKPAQNPFTYPYNLH